MRRLSIIAVLAVVLLLLVLLPGTASFLVDLWFFQEIGYQVVYTKELATRLNVFLVVGGLVSAVLYLNLRLAQRGVVPNPAVFRFAPNAPGFDLTGFLRRITLPGSIGLGVMFGLGATTSWDVILRAMHRTPFGIVDPVFGRDVGYYVFLLPAVSALLGALLGLATFTTLEIGRAHV